MKKKQSNVALSPGQKPQPVSSGGDISRRRWLVAVAGIGVVAGLGAAGTWLVQKMRQSKVPEFTYEIVNRFRHEENAFTQGLVYDGGYLYEGTGQRGQSQLRRVELDTGNVLQHVDLPAQFFGEGITLWQDRIIQLTWESGIGIVYNKSDFRQTGHFTYTGEGWGLTHDGRRLIMSDGTDKLRFLDPETFEERGERLAVQMAGQPVEDLNELEYVEGEIFANVWHQDYIVRISPETGQVTGLINLAGLRPRETVGGWQNSEKVLNGIAYDAENKRLFVTGKNWPALFEIRLITRS